MSNQAPTRLGESVKGLLDSGLGIVQTRLELLAVEVKEEKLRAGTFLFNIVLAALLIGFAIIFLMAFITILFWDDNRLLALGLTTAALFGGGVWAASRAVARLRAGSRLFSASLAEITQDRESLRRAE